MAGKTAQDMVVCTISMSMSNATQTSCRGSCLCGSIKYEVDHIEPHMAHCHCSMCRKFHGAAFATFGEAKKENFRWLSGEELLSSYVADNGTTRQFCSRCGSSMTFRASSGQENVVEFSLGTLDSDIVERPDAHIFVAYKANWLELNNGLPQYSEGRNST